MNQIDFDIEVGGGTLSLDQPNLAFIGGMGTGKSDAALYFEHLHNYERRSFAAPLKAAAELIFGEITRENCQWLGIEMRKRDPDIWVKAFERNLTPFPTVVDDCRFPNEEAFLKSRGFLFVRIISSEEDRVTRLQTNGKLQDVSQLNHESEEHHGSMVVDYTVTNDGTAAQFNDELAVLASRIAGRV